MQGYKNLWTQVVKPPRVPYSEEYQLEEEISYDHEGQQLVYKRHDFTIKTEEPDQYYKKSFVVFSFCSSRKKS